MTGRWRGPRTTRNPIYTTRQWRKNREHWQRLRLPCARCGGPIDYDGPRYFIVNGRRRLNPRYLVVGHKVDLYVAKLRGWTVEQMTALSVTQPECQRCSNSSGARLGQRVQQARLAMVARQVDESRRW